MKIKNGDVFDIGQTVNGISRFIMLGDQWHYFEKKVSRIYEYDQDELTQAVLNESGIEDITYIGNIFDHIPNESSK